MTEPLITIETLRADLDALVRAAHDLIASAEQLERDLMPERLAAAVREAEAVVRSADHRRSVLRDLAAEQQEASHG